ncbi:MAG: hypothetical protein WKF89_16895 [Chitinophagaceae bacterium]
MMISGAIVIFWDIDNAQLQKAEPKISMNRFLKVDEAALLVSWLASEDWSFTSGAIFDISGGRAVY